MGYDPQAEGSDAVPGAPRPSAPYTPPNYSPPEYPPPSPGYGAPPPPGYSGGYGGGYGAPGYGGYGGYPNGYGYPGGVAPRTDGTAIAALVLAIVSFVLCPLIPAVVALALIPGSRRTIKASGGTLSGDSILTAAKWIAWINVVLAGLFVILIFIGVIADLTSPSTNSLGRLVVH
jgi:hypothetical protein